MEQKDRNHYTSGKLIEIRSNKVITFTYKFRIFVRFFLAVDPEGDTNFRKPRERTDENIKYRVTVKRDKIVGIRTISMKAVDKYFFSPKDR